MTTCRLKTRVEPIFETSYIRNVPQTVDSVRHNFPVRMGGERIASGSCTVIGIAISGMEPPNYAAVCLPVG
jgi:hypothetical protein